MKEDQQRLLVIVPHADDETFFLGGTIAKYAQQGVTVRVLIVTDGKRGKLSVRDADTGKLGCRKVEPHEIEHFLKSRKSECRNSCEILGAERVDFLDLPDGALGSWIYPQIKQRICDFDPHIVVALSEAGTHPHPDHTWTAISTWMAIRDIIHDAYGDVYAQQTLPFQPPFALRKFLTFTSQEARSIFQWWAEQVLADNERCRVNISPYMETKLAACNAYHTQAHWTAFLEECGYLNTAHEEFHERICIGTSCHGTGDLFQGVNDPGYLYSCSLFPDEPSRYDAFHATWHERDRTFYDGLVRKCQVLRPSRVQPVILEVGQPALAEGDGQPTWRRILELFDQSIVKLQPLNASQPEADLTHEGSILIDQTQPAATAQSIALCQPAVQKAGAQHVLLVTSISPWLDVRTIDLLVLHHTQENRAVTICTTNLNGDDDQQNSFEHLARIIRDENQRVTGLSRFKEPLVQQRREVFAGVCCFQANWLWPNLRRIGSNTQSDLLLTNLIDLAVEQGREIGTVDIVPCEARSVDWVQ